MDSNGPQLGEVMGELIAYRVAVVTLIAAHPSAALLHAPLRIAGEQGAAVMLGDGHPDETLDAFQRAMGRIMTLLPPPAG